MPDARKTSVLLWTLVFMGYAVWNPDVRSSVFDLGRAVLEPKALAPIALMIGHVSLLIAVAAKLNIWTSDLASATVVWFVPSLGLLGVAVSTAPGQGFVSRIAGKALGITAFVEVFVNLFVFPLPVELVLQPLLFLVAASLAISERQPELLTLARPLRWFSSAVGLALLIYVLAKLVADWDQIDIANAIRKFALPIWLTVGVLPFLYTFRVVAAYEMALLRLEFANDNQPAPLHSKLALVAEYHVRPPNLSGFAGAVAGQVAASGSFSAARKVLHEFRTSDAPG